MKLFADISIWWLFPWLVISILLSVLYYRKQPVLSDISSGIKWLLISLRGVSLFMLGLLLFGIIFENKEYKTEKPLFIVLVDNSTSMQNYKDSTEIGGEVNGLSKKLKENYKDKFEIKEFVVGDNIREGVPNYHDQQSNLDQGFDYLYNQYYNRNIGGVCFVSDGNFNTGKNPIYAAERLSLTPVFTIGVGDTIVKRDHLLRNVAVNDVAFLNNQFPIEVDIEARRMGRSKTSLELWENDVKLDTKELSYENGTLDFEHVSFMVEAKSVGFKNYTVRLKEESGESSYANNKRSFYVEIIDSRTKILLLSKGPHPDITAIKQVIDKAENMEAKAMLTDEWSGKLSDFNLLIWHDPSKSDELSRTINKEKIPVLYLLTPETSANALNQLNKSIVIPNGNRADEAQGKVNDNFELFEVNDDFKKILLTYPPLNVKFGSSTLKGGQTLINQRIGGVVKSDPLISFGNENGVKTCVVFGEGLWRWRLSNYVRQGNHDEFNKLIQNSIQYLTVKKNNEPLRVNLPKRFNEIDDIIINASFYNASFEPITKPDIALVITTEKGEDLRYAFAKNENDYTVALGKLKNGAYKWKASTSFEGKSFTKEGMFVVENTSIEAMSTHADHNLLQQIANRTNGAFYKLKNSNALFSEINGREDIGNVTYEESTFRDLVDWKVLFILLISLLGLEWFIRRYSGSY